VELDKPNILFFNKKSKLTSKILNIIQQWDAYIHLVSTNEELKAAFKGMFFDLFICFPGNTSNVEEAVDSISDELKQTTTCFIGQPLEFKNIDFDFLLGDKILSGAGVIECYFTSIFNIVKKQKNQSELSAMLLHDLRSPMQSVIGYLELLEKEIFGEVNEGQRQILLNAISLGDNITDLVEELNLIDQFENKQFEMVKAKVRLKELLDETLRTLWVQADKKNIKFIPQITSNLPDIVADGRAVQRVLTNLLTNAIKYSPENGTVRIVVEYVKSSSHLPMLRFRIIDSGEGLPVKNINYIFDKYFQIHERKQSHKGFGLGLYISKLIVKAHKGQIGAYNNREGGSTLYFTLPGDNGNESKGK
jgi:signal transduction histidine kinase